MEEQRHTKMIFSSSEMLYIIASLGLPQQTLVNNPFKGYTQDALRAEISKGQRGLEEKRMLERTVNQGWELDGRIAAVMEIITKADYSILITVLQKPAVVSQYHYYFWGSQSISMTVESRYYHLGIYQGEKAMLNILLRILGIETQLSQGVSPIILPGANFASLLLALWKNPADAEDVVKKFNVSEEDSKNVITALEKIDKASILMPTRKGEQSGNVRGYILSGKTCLWWGETNNPNPVTVQFDPMPFSHTAITKAPEYDETIIFDPSTPNLTAHIMRYIKGSDYRPASAKRNEEVFN